MPYPLGHWILLDCAFWGATFCSLCPGSHTTRRRRKMENPGVDPGASRMQSERSTVELDPQMRMKSARRSPLDLDSPESLK